jgi:polyferredoxin
MLYGLMTKATFEMNVLKDRSPPFVRLSNGEIQNGYTLKLVNKAKGARRMSISLEGAEGARMKIIGLENERTTQFDVPVAAYGVDRYRVLVIAPGTGNPNVITFTATDSETGETDSNQVAFRSGN